MSDPLGEVPPATPAAKPKSVRPLTAHSLRIIRLLAAGKSKREVATEVGTSLNYVQKLMSRSEARAEYRRLAAAVEVATISQLANAQTGLAPAGAGLTSAVTAEIDASVLESIQRLRHIMNNATSAQAQAFAAKELLDLSQAKKRLALLDKGLEDGAEVSPDDVRLLAQTVGDLRLLHVANFGPDRRAEVLRRFSATEADISETIPDEITELASESTPSPEDTTSQPAPDDVPNVNVEPAQATDPIGPDGAALRNGLGEQGPTLPPSVPLGPTLNEMIDGRT